MAQQCVRIFFAESFCCATFQIIYFDDLIDESVAISRQYLTVVGQRQHPRGDFRRVVITAGTRGFRCPVIRGEQTVLAAVGLVTNGDDRIVVSIQTVNQRTLKTYCKQFTFVLVGIHGESQVQGLVLAETPAVGLRLCEVFGCQFLVPLASHAHTGRVALGIVLIDHPIIVVTVHPCQAQG